MCPIEKSLEEYITLAKQRGEWELNKDELNLESFGQQLIITGLVRLVEEEDYTPHEAFQLLETIKRNTFHTLLELKKESKAK